MYPTDPEGQLKKREWHRDNHDVHRQDIFVFGSNLSGIHGSGAAYHARHQCDAIIGDGVGRTGRCYAIPTKNEDISETLDLATIAVFVRGFLAHAKMNPKTTFFVTRIGCGLAGLQNADIAPMFADAPENCIMPELWAPFYLPKEQDTLTKV